ncbi:MAG: carboxypeptidase regulatory-like domain-containing protein [Blastocatellia bacterium]
MRRSALTSVLFTVAFCLFLTSNTDAQGYSANDFIIADPIGDRIAVFDQNLVFQHYLDTTMNDPWGLTFLSNGNLVAVGRNATPGVGRIRIYNPAGVIVSDFTNANIGDPVDIKASPLNILYSPQDSAVGGIAQFTTGGTFNGVFGTGNFFSAAVLPGNVLWAGNNTGTVSVFDLNTNTLTGTITLDNGQVRSDAMYYSPLTSTVLMPGGSGFNALYERDLTGTFVRQFTTPGGEFVNFGVTRGPGGDVFATVLLGTQFIHRWTAAGVFVSSTNVSANVTGAGNIVWVGNVTPSAAGVRVSGRVTDVNGTGISRAVVTLTDLSGRVRSVNTKSFGFFAFEDVPVGKSYVASVRRKGYQFNSQVINLEDNVSDLNFTPNSPETAQKKGRR